ncbi:MAG TPA: hypothetical protein VKE95_15030 [Burkholderiales bacterium]|nr:hypothetical protein [Burkholderiales bacterium]
MAVSLYAQELARAAEILGGIAALSDYLRVPQVTVLRWIKGEERPTNKAFWDVVDLLIDHDRGNFGSRDGTTNREGDSA